MTGDRTPASTSLFEADDFDAGFLAIWQPDAADTAQQVAAVATLLDEAGLAGGARVLDVCGGSARLAAPLCELGHEVTCLDASTAMLALAAERRARLDDEVARRLTLVEADARTFTLDQVGGVAFDLAIVAQQSFGYFATDAEHAAMLRCIGAALVDGGLFVLDVVHRDFAATASAPRTWHTLDDGRVVLHTFEFDPIAGRSLETVRLEGTPVEQTRSWSLRLFNATELGHLMRAGGLSIVEAFGSYDLSPFSLHGPRLVVVASRAPHAT